MKIAVEITIDERAWLAGHRAKVGPFLAGKTTDTLMAALGDVILEWAGDAPNAVHTRVLCDNDSRAHGDGGCCEPTNPTAAMEARLKALEAWAARACGDYAFSEDSYVEVGKYELESLSERVSDLESRLPSTD